MDANKPRKFYQRWLFWAGIVTLIIIAGASTWAYQYWKQGTPEYSIQQLVQAFADHDTTTADKYLNGKAIWGNVWPRFESEYATSQSNYNPLAASILSSQESSIANIFNTAIYNAIRGTMASSTGIIPSVINQLPHQHPVVHGDTALTDTVYQTGGQSYPITVVFTRQADRTWQITDLQGIEKVMVMEVEQGATSSPATTQ